MLKKQNAATVNRGIFSDKQPSLSWFPAVLAGTSFGLRPHGE
jgi:hypothetical protein